MKDSTGFEEEQAVKVVRNGEGGPKRGWKPATRRSGNGSVKAGVGTVRREVDSSSWARRRGDEPHGRRDESKERPSSAGPEARTEKRTTPSRASERPGVPNHQPGNRLEAVCRKTPGSHPQGQRAQAEPGSQANGYGRQSSAEGQRNAAEGPAASDEERKGRGASAPVPAQP
jgi:hypothetical protein